MAEIESCLPWREEFEFYNTDELECAADKFAGDVIDDGIVRQDQHNDFVVALVRSGLYFRLGITVNAEVANNKSRAKAWTDRGLEIAANALKLPPPHRPKIYAFQGLIWVMADAWEFFGLEPKPPASDPYGKADRDSPFSKVCKEWIRRVLEIDAVSTGPLDKVLNGLGRRQPPSRIVFRRVLNERK